MDFRRICKFYKYICSNIKRRKNHNRTQLAEQTVVNASCYVFPLRSLNSFFRQIKLVISFTQRTLLLKCYPVELFVQRIV